MTCHICPFSSAVRISKSNKSLATYLVEINYEAVVHIGILVRIRVVGGDETDNPEIECEEEGAYWQHKAFCRHPQNCFRVVVSQHLL